MANTKKQAYTPEQSKRLDAILNEPDNTKRWRMVADLAREMNPKVKKEQDYQIKAMADVRKNKLYRRTRRKGQLKLAVSIPPLTFQAMVGVDPTLMHLDKEDFLTPDATNHQARELARVFPEYRAS